MELSFGGCTVEEVRLGHVVDVDPNSGAASLRVPLPAPPGRNGLAPALALGYASGAGNSPFGVGWNLTGLPTIALQTRLHVPRWDGNDGFALGGDDLVPWLDASGASRGFVDSTWSVAFLRSRRGGATTRVEKWVELATGRIHFRTRDARNVVTVFGARTAASARIADPTDESRTLLWLPELQLDPTGNALWFEYAAETLDGVDLTAPFERRRPSLAQRYLKRIRYGNVMPLTLDDSLVAGVQPRGTRWCFELVFDFGDHSDPRTPSDTPDVPWPARRDPASSFRNGFEVRTYRLCRRVLSFHDFDELGATPALVGVLALDHDEQPAGSTLTSITYTAVRHDGGTVTTAALPPLHMTYAAPATDTGFAEVPVQTLENALGGGLAFVDLRGEGLAGILAESDRAWYYKPNLGGGDFGAQTLVLERPAARSGFRLGDVDADGDPDLSQLAGRLAGHYEFDREQQIWRPFRTFERFPHVEALGTRAQWIDLNGDGRSDVLITREDAFVWYASDGDGFRPPVEVPRPAGAHAPPGGASAATLDFSFADMTGDGLPDLVRVQNGRVEYWPGLGNGHFGEVVVMDSAPQLASTCDFDPARIRLVDLDGSGTSDLIYLDDGVVRCWINAAGNQLLPGPTLDSLPVFDKVSSVQVLDFLGDGRTCLVWSSPLPARESAIEYLPLTPAVPARLLLTIDDSLGRQTSFTYASSATHYLRDVASGRDWSTRLPSHHPVVDRMDVLDQIGNTRALRRFEYHDGYYDGVDREQRGFAQVDVYDAEAVDGATPGPGTPAYAPPSVTRTWFHLGVEMIGVLAPMDTFVKDAALPALAPHVLEASTEMLTAEQIDDGLRALAGRTIRREVYAIADDGTPAANPFEVFQASYLLRCLQPATSHARAAFSAISIEQATWTYEQSATDPRVRHQLVLATDAYGTPTRTAIIGYARRAGVPIDLAAQGRHWLRVDEQTPLNIDTPQRYELAIATEDTSLELVGLRPGPTGLFTIDQLGAAAVAAALASPGPHDVTPPDDPAKGPAARRFAWHRRYYWNDARTAVLPLAQVGAMTLPHHIETACFAETFVGSTLGGHGVTDAQLGAIGYVADGSLWWQPSAIDSYAPASEFSQRVASARSDHSTTQWTYDAYALVMTSVVDPLGNTTTGAIDYHMLAPWQLTDANGNVREVRYDPLGVIVASTRYGHAVAQPWGFAALSTITPAVPPTLADAIANPATYLQSAAQYVWYDLTAWAQHGTPTVTLALAAEQLLHDGAGGGASSGPIQVSVAYLDGLGRPLQTKTLVEAGPAIQRDASGNVVVDSGGAPVPATATTRWRTSGHVAYDGKEQPAQQYQPFFSPSPAYEGDDVLERFGVATVIHHDALGRVVGESLPNGTFTTTRYGAWTTEQGDADDNVAGSAYGALRQGLPADDPERQAYEEAVPHAGTTVLGYLDPLGRSAGSLTRGGTTAPDRRMETELDLAGDPVQVTDARGLVAFTYRRDMRGVALAEHGIDAGDAWMLPDAYGRTVTQWDGRGFRVDRGYDVGDRPLFVDVSGGDGSAPLNNRVEQWAYGEAIASRADAIQRNLLGRVATASDSGGHLAVDHYAPAGSALSTTRSLRAVVDGEPDWRAAVPLESQTYVTTTVYDALGRPTTDTLPDGTVRAFEYLPSGARSRVLVTTPGGALASTAILAGATYNARGDRESSTLGNGVQIEYGYDAQTFRLATQTATLGTRSLQALHYTYDPVGNLVRLVDDAQQGASPLIKGATASARRDYTYDAHYRLLTAKGRVHQALLQNDFVPGSAGTMMGTRQVSLNDGTAIVPFTQTYLYDVSGNLQSLQHAGPTQSWTTNMWTSSTSNRSVPALDLNGNPVTNPDTMFDGRGNLTQVAHLRQLAWTFRGAVARAVVIARPNGTDDAESYVYDADAARLRKTTTRVVAGGQVQVTEKVYFGDSERKRITVAGTLILERWTTHIGDGEQRVALVHRWTVDTQAREVDDVTKPHVHYQLNTHQGSSALELDASGNMISYEEYFPYGGTAFIAGDDQREVSLKDYRYCGKECDDFTGLYYYGYRYYAPWMARWLSPDPIGPQDDVNLYLFVRCNPTTRIDTNGLLSKEWESVVGSPPDLHLEVGPNNELRSDAGGLREFNPNDPNQNAVVVFPDSQITAKPPKRATPATPKPKPLPPLPPTDPTPAALAPTPEPVPAPAVTEPPPPVPSDADAGAPGGSPASSGSEGDAGAPLPPPVPDEIRPMTEGGEAIFYKSSDQAQSEGAELIEGGAAEQRLAQQGALPTTGGAEVHAYIRQEVLTGEKAAMRGNPIVMSLVIQAAATQAALGNDKLAGEIMTMFNGPEPESEIARNARAYTQTVVDGVTLGTIGGAAGSVEREGANEMVAETEIADMLGELSQAPLHTNAPGPGNDNGFFESEVLEATGTDGPIEAQMPELRPIEGGAGDGTSGPMIGERVLDVRQTLPGRPEQTLRSSYWARPPETGNRNSARFEQAQRIRGRDSLRIRTGRTTRNGSPEEVELDDYDPQTGELFDMKSRGKGTGSIIDVRDRPGANFRQEIVRRKIWKQELARQRAGAKSVVWTVEDPTVAEGLRAFFAKEGATHFFVRPPR